VGEPPATSRVDPPRVLSVADPRASDATRLRPSHDTRERPVRHVAIFVRLALLLYPAYAILTPPFQTPDEHFHLYRAYQLSRFDVIGERRGADAGGLVPRAYLRAADAELDLSRPHLQGREVRERPVTQMFDGATELAPNEPVAFTTSAVLYSPAGYVPQVIAVWIGGAADASVETIIRLGRLLNAAVAIALIACALAILPVGRLPMLVVGLLPMTAASAAAFGQDGTVIGASCVLVALGLRASLHGAWRGRELGAAAGAGAAVSLAKFVYLPLLAVALLPAPAGESRRRWVGRIAALLAVTLALVAAWLHAVRGLTVAARPDLPSWAEQTHFVVTEPLRTLAALVRGLAAPRLVKEVVGIFGWLNVGPSLIALALAPLAALVSLLAGDDRARALGWQRRAWYLAIVGAVAFGMALILFLVFTPLGGTAVEGLQGRYFLPLAPLALIACVPARRRLPGAIPADLVTAGLMLAANAASLLVIVQAFYRR
jgi:hypothetical protein